MNCLVKIGYSFQLYVTPPSKVRKISEDELSFVFERAPDFKNVFATLVVEKTLTGEY